MRIKSGTNRAGQRLIGLELLRFIAALGVLVWHYQHFLFVGPVEAELDWQRLPFRWLFAPFYAYGYVGVQLFWCISGFIFTWKYSATISRAALSFGRFAMLRFSRLYPLHLATLLIVAALQWLYVMQHGEPFVYLFNDTSHFVMNLFFANWWGFQSGESFNGPAWSVSAEVLIYVAFFCITRWIGAGWSIDLLALLAFSTVAVIVKALFELELSFTGAGTFFYMGAMTCHLHRWIEAASPKWQYRIGIFCAVLIAACLGLIAADMLKIAGASLPMFPAIVLLVQLSLRPRGQRTRSILIGLGNLTYASYLLHFPLQLAIMLILDGCAVPVQPLVYSDGFMVAYLGSVLALAFVVFRWVERPAQDWLRRMSRYVMARRKILAYRA